MFQPFQSLYLGNSSDASVPIQWVFENKATVSSLLDIVNISTWSCREVFIYVLTFYLPMWRLSLGQKPEESKLCVNSVNYDQPGCWLKDNSFVCLLWQLEISEHGKINTDIAHTNKKTIIYCTNIFPFVVLFETLMLWDL